MTNASPVESNGSGTRASSFIVTSEPDLERSTLHEGSIQETTKEKIDEPTEKAGTAADDFVEGGFEGWKTILGCALVAAPTVGEFLCNHVCS